MPINVITQENHLLKLKLVMKSTETFSDDEAEKVLVKTQVGSEDDIKIVLDYVKTYRPVIYKKLERRML